MKSKWSRPILAGLVVAAITFAGYMAYTEPETQISQPDAQVAERVLTLPQDENKMYLSVFTGGENYEVLFDVGPVAEFKTQTHFNVYPTNEKMFQDRFASYVGTQTPSVLLTDAKGKVLYCARYPDIPGTAGELADELYQSLPMGSYTCNPNRTIGGPRRVTPVNYDCRPKPSPSPSPSPSPTPTPPQVPVVRPNTVQNVALGLAIAVAVGGFVAGALVGAGGKAFNRKGGL